MYVKIYHNKSNFVGMQEILLQNFYKTTNRENSGLVTMNYFSEIGVPSVIACNKCILLKKFCINFPELSQTNKTKSLTTNKANKEKTLMLIPQMQYKRFLHIHKNQSLHSTTKINKLNNYKEDQMLTNMKHKYNSYNEGNNSVLAPKYNNFGIKALIGNSHFKFGKSLCPDNCPKNSTENSPVGKNKLVLPLNATLQTFPINTRNDNTYHPLTKSKSLYSVSKEEGINILLVDDETMQHITPMNISFELQLRTYKIQKYNISNVVKKFVKSIDKDTKYIGYDIRKKINKLLNVKMNGQIFDHEYSRNKKQSTADRHCNVLNNKGLNCIDKASKTAPSIFDPVIDEIPKLYSKQNPQWLKYNLISNNYKRRKFGIQRQNEKNNSYVKNQNQRKQAMSTRNSTKNIKYEETYDDNNHVCQSKEEQHSDQFMNQISYLINYTHSYYNYKEKILIMGRNRMKQRNKFLTTKMHEEVVKKTKRYKNYLKLCSRFVKDHHLFNLFKEDCYDTIINLEGEDKIQNKISRYLPFLNKVERLMLSQIARAYLPFTIESKTTEPQKMKVYPPKTETNKRKSD